MNRTRPSIVLVAGIGLSVPALAQHSRGGHDNTERNRHVAAAHTADSQSNDPSDLAVVQQVRKAVMADSSLSMYAHNVKILAREGVVTLNGVVRSDAERAALAAKASSVVGDRRVVNELTVAPESR